MLAVNELLFGIVSLALVCGLVMLLTLGGLWLLKRSKPDGDVINGVWIDRRDIDAFSGMSIAVDRNTGEFIESAEDVSHLKTQMKCRRRDWVAVSIPGERTSDVSTVRSLFGECDCE